FNSPNSPSSPSRSCGEQYPCSSSSISSSLIACAIIRDSLYYIERLTARTYTKSLTISRAVVEHPFHILKNRFRHKKLRYRGLNKNTAQLHTLFALANLVIVKQALLPPSSA